MSENDPIRLTTRLEAVSRPPAPSAFSNALVFAWRAVLKFKHLPEQLFDLVTVSVRCPSGRSRHSPD